MTDSIDFSADYIQVEDITDRVDELRESLADRHEQGGFMSDFSDWIKNSRENSQPIYAAFPEDGAEVQAEIEELFLLECVLNDLQGNGGDHQWEGNWYPQTLIAEREFENAMDELIDDIGEIPVNLPSYLKVVVDYDALRQDYTSDNFGGYDFLYR